MKPDEQLKDVESIPDESSLIKRLFCVSTTKISPFKSVAMPEGELSDGENDPN